MLTFYILRDADMHSADLLS